MTTHAFISVVLIISWPSIRSFRWPYHDHPHSRFGDPDYTTILRMTMTIHVFILYSLFSVMCPSYEITTGRAQQPHHNPMITNGQHNGHPRTHGQKPDGRPSIGQQIHPPVNPNVQQGHPPSPKFSGQQNHPPPVNKDTPYLDSAVNQHPLLASKDTPLVHIISFIIYTFIHDMGDCYNIYHYE